MPLHIPAKWHDHHDLDDGDDNDERIDDIDDTTSDHNLILDYHDQKADDNDRKENHDLIVLNVYGDDNDVGWIGETLPDH